MTIVPRPHSLAALVCALLVVLGSLPPSVHAQSTADADRYFSDVKRMLEDFPEAAV